MNIDSVRTQIETEYSSEQSIYPNFLYIGASKTGSSWIYEILREHPEAFVPIAKDIQFFDWHYDKGFDWYLAFFRPGRGQKAVGEIAHDYFLSKETALRIKKHVPDVRLMCSLREPISQMLSTFLYRRNTVLDDNTTFEDFASRQEARHLCDYYYNLLPFYERFPSERILVLFFDDLQRDPTGFARRIFRFLGVDPFFVPKTLHTKVLPASQPRLLPLAHLAYKAGSLLRALGMANIVGAVKRDKWFQTAFFKPVTSKPEVPPQVKRELKQYYRERYIDLPELIGQPLPDTWFGS